MVATSCDRHALPSRHDRFDPDGSAQPELIVDARAFLGEGPVWDGRIGRLAWVDILEGRLHLTAHDGGTRTIQLPGAVGCLVPRASGGWVVALADGFWSVSEAGVAERLVDVQSDRPDLRFNDGKCDPAGRFWAGTMALDHRAGAGSLYRLDPDLSVHRMVDGVAISNGIDWSLDGRTMYYVDTPTHRIDQFEFDPDTGGISLGPTAVRDDRSGGRQSGRSDRRRGGRRVAGPVGRLDGPLLPS